MTMFPAPARDRIFEVRYERFGSGEYNVDLKGGGTLTVPGDRQLYRFSGRPRRLFASRTIDLDFLPQDISEVVVDDRTVRFFTLKGESGAKRTPFVIYCRHRTDADDVAALLPGNPPGTGSDQAIIDKLRALAPGTHPLASITNVVVLANILVFIVGIPAGLSSFVPGGHAAQVAPLMALANNGAATTAGEWWRLLTSMFIHRDWIHLLFNMWALYVAGRLLERLLGRSLFSLVYIATGVAGGLASIWWYGDKVWSIGASGAVFGVYGALIACVALLQRRKEITATVFRGTQKSAILFAIYNILFGLSLKGIDNAAHVGGWIGGLILGAVAVLPLDQEARIRAFRPRFALTTVAVLALVLAGVLVAPRFDYRIKEELALAEFGRKLTAEEPVQIRTFQNAAREFQAGRIGIADYRLYAQKHLAFYRATAAEAKTLVLTPGLRSDRERNRILSAFDEKTGMIQATEQMVEASQKLGQLELAFKRDLDLKVVRLKALGVSAEAVAYARSELLPLFDEWERKIDDFTLPSPGGAGSANAELIATMTRHVSDARTGLREKIRTIRVGVSNGIVHDEAVVKLKEVASAIDREWAALESKQPQSEPNAQRRLEQQAAFLRDETLPRFKIWRATIESLPGETADLTAAKHRVLTLLTERESSLQTKLAEVDTAHALTTIAMEFDAANLAMLQRQPYASALNSTSRQLAESNRWMRETYVPFLEEWRKKSQVATTSGSELNQLRTNVLRIIDVAMSGARERLEAGEAQAAFAVVAEEFEGAYRQILSQRPGSQADELRWWRGQFLPFTIAWREKLEGLPLPENIAGTRDKLVGNLREKEAAAERVIAQLQQLPSARN